MQKKTTLALLVSGALLVNMVQAEAVVVADDLFTPVTSGTSQKGSKAPSPATATKPQASAPQPKQKVESPGRVAPITPQGAMPASAVNLNAPISHSPVSSAPNARMPLRSPVLPVGVVQSGISKPVSLRVNPGEIAVVEISNALVNRVVLPMDQIEVLDANKATIEVAGNNILVRPNPNAPDNPFTVYFTGNGGSSMIGITFLPKPIAAQSIVINQQGSDLSSKPEKRAQDSYQAEIRQMVIDYESGEQITGYSGGPLNAPESKMGTLLATPKELFSGGMRDLYVYEIKNTGIDSVTLSEPNFYRQGVLAVAFSPRIHLAPGQTTKLLLVVAKIEEKP